VRKFILLAVVALALPSLALAAKPASPGKSAQPHGNVAAQSHSKATPKVTYVLKGTLTAYTAANGQTNGLVSLLIKGANHHGAALKGQTLTFGVSAATKVVTGKNPTLTINDKGLIQVRGPKKIGATDNLATVLQALTAKQIIDQGAAS
jgi:hypothetical protein